MFNWIKSLFKKPEAEIHYVISLTDYMPVEKPAKRTYVRKTRPLPSKATIAKKAVGKKTITTKVNK